MPKKMKLRGLKPTVFRSGILKRPHFSGRECIKIYAVIFTVIFGLLIFIRTKYAAPILMYHSVSPLATRANRLSVLPETFERQMRFLKENNYNVVLVEALAELISGKNRIPPKTVAITFDDGYKDNYDYAFPVLKKYGLPATVFIIVREVGRPQNDRLSWGQIKTMQASGLIAFGSHSLGPDPLTKLGNSRDLIREIFDSKKILEEKLGVPVNTFSYPEGRFTPSIRQLVIDAGYHAAVATNPGKKFSNNDVFALKRLRISESARNMFVFWVEASGYYNFMREHRHK